MFKNIKIEGFRGIKHLEIDGFKQINLFVGENNCSKTSILEALFLSIGPTNPELPLRLNNFRKLTQIDESSLILLFNKLDINSNISISSELSDAIAKRNLIIKPNIEAITDTMTRISINKESLDIKGSYSGLSPSIDGLILEYSFSKRKDKKIKKITTKVITQRQGINFIVPQDYKESLRGVFINPETIMIDIALRLNNMLVKKQIAGIIKVLQHIEPSLINLSLGTNGLIYCDIGLDRLVPINVMGDGIARLLSIILAISDNNNGIVLIDEIENGFYYTSQKILWDAIFKAAKEFNVQIFATTHSIDCIRAFSNSCSAEDNDDIRLYRIERKDDDFRIISYEHNVLKASLESGWEVR